VQKKKKHYKGNGTINPKQPLERGYLARIMVACIIKRLTTSLEKAYSNDFQYDQMPENLGLMVLFLKTTVANSPLYTHDRWQLYAARLV